MLSHFLMTPMLSHFATVLGHFIILLAIHRCYSAQPFFFVTTTRGAAQSFWKMTELDHGRAG
jgi:hypothetical protein